MQIVKIFFMLLMIIQYASCGGGGTSSNNPTVYVAGYVQNGNEITDRTACIWINGERVDLSGYANDENILGAGSIFPRATAIIVQ